MTSTIDAPPLRPRSATHQSAIAGALEEGEYGRKLKAGSGRNGSTPETAKVRLRLLRHGG